MAATFSSMTGTGLINEVRAQTLVSSTAVSDTIVLGWLNEGLAEVASAADWPWLEASGHFHTTAGTQSYDLDGADLPNLERIIAVYDHTEPRRLMQVSPQAAFDAFGGDMPSSEHATAFFVFAGNINLLPVPSASATQYDILYYKQPTSITTATSPEWNAQFHHILAHYGEWRMWQREEDLEKANEAHAQFYRILGQMVAWYNRVGDRAMWAVGSGQSSLAGLTNTPFLNGM
jgi:hypothetical protein